MNDANRHLSEQEILSITRKAMHKTFGDFGLDESYNGKNKGGLGGFVEENIFNYSANSDDNPDFIDAGIELKVTPIKKNQDGSISSKERLSFLRFLSLLIKNEQLNNLDMENHHIKDYD